MTTKTKRDIVPQEKNTSVLAEYSQEQLNIIKSHIAKGASNDELAYFLTVCKTQNLDPFSHQIHFIKRGGQMTIQIGIDGYRAIAEQTGSLAGIDDPIYDVENAPHPNKATVTVYRFVKGKKVAFTATARWAEYCPQDQRMAFMWRKMPYHMLGKVAEALALRKAFPRRLGGIYTEEEMHAADNAPITVSNADELKPQEPEKITDEQIKEIKALLVKKGKDEKKMLAHYNREDITDFTFSEAKTIIVMLRAAPDVNLKKELKTDDGEIVKGEVVEVMEEEKKEPDKIVPIDTETARLAQKIELKKRKTAEEKQFLKDVNRGEFKGREAYPTIFKN